MVDPVVIFLHRADYDAVHQGLSIAAAAVAGGRRAELYFSWWALERLVRDRLDEPDLREDVASEMERRGVPTLRQLLAHVRDSKLGSVFACSGSLHALGFNPSDVEGKVDELVGWSSILKRTAGRVDRFFL
jgi:peroxiredoxin family protein